MPSIGDIFGFNAARRVREGTDAANVMLDRGVADASRYIGEAYTEGRENLQPYIQGGQQGQSFYEDLLGLNGPEARAAAQQVMMSDPANQGQLGQAQNAMLRQMNARGLDGSGAGALAAERVFQQNYGNLMNRYAGLGQQGFQAAGAGASLATNWGNTMGNLTYGRAQQGANLATNQATQTNAANQAIGNNMLSIAGLGMKAAGPGGLTKTGFFG